VLDYFGQSVNIAARLQGAARAGELVLPATLADRAEGAEVRERFTPALKGVDLEIPAARLSLRA
jgi:class 3 adenylate cyclase